MIFFTFQVISHLSGLVCPFRVGVSFQVGLHLKGRVNERFFSTFQVLIDLKGDSCSFKSSCPFKSNRT